MMKKQYRKAYAGLNVYIYIYHDGKLAEKRKLWQGDDALNEIADLEKDGYTYGYHKSEIEEAKERYEHMLANMIEVGNESVN